MRVSCRPPSAVDERRHADGVRAAGSLDESPDTLTLYGEPVFAAVRAHPVRALPVPARSQADPRRSSAHPHRRRSRCRENHRGRPDYQRVAGTDGYFIGAGDLPKALVAERKWHNEMKRFDESFTALDGALLRHCLKETELEGEWPEQYAKAILPFSLFDSDLIVGPRHGTPENSGPSVARSAAKVRSRHRGRSAPYPKL